MGIAHSSIIWNPLLPLSIFVSPTGELDTFVVNEPLRSVIPGSCLVADMDNSLNGPILADTEVRFGKEGGPGRWFKVDHHCFKQLSVKWDTFYFLPSLEYKLHHVAIDGTSGFSMTNDLKWQVSSVKMECCR